MVILICGFTNGLGCATCADKKAKGGNVPVLYGGVLSELDPVTPFTTDADGRITGINFLPYAGLVKFCAKNRSVNTTQTPFTGENDVDFYTQAIQGRFQQQGQVAKNALDGLTDPDDAFFVVENNNHVFELFGREAGLKGLITKSSGTNVGDDNTFIVDIASAEASGESALAPDFFVTDYQTTKNLLESYTL